jgi:hypothetical protein
VKRLLLVLPILALLLASCSGFNLFGDDEPPPPPQSLEIVDFGIYTGNPLSLQTEAVPKKLGTTFGFRFVAKAPEGGQARIRIITTSPGMINPAKKEVEFKAETTDTIQVGPQYNCLFTFEQEWEMVSGDWTLEVVAADGSTVKKTFQVYNPQQ